MTKSLSILIGSLLFASNIFSQNIYTATSSEISFFSEARIENIEAISRKCVSALNISSKALAFKIPIQSFVFKNGLMKEHFNENYMESDKFPEASFDGKIIDNIDLAKDGEYKVTAAGKLTIHGISKERSFAGVVKVQKGGIQITSSFLVPVSDHKIDIPNNKISNISQNITVRIKAVYEPKK